jgi:hypothetical protein
LIITDNPAYTVSMRDAVVTIYDDEVPSLRVKRLSNPASEPNPGENTATFRIVRLAPGDFALPVSFTLSGTATNGVDYELLPLTATIPSGSNHVDVVVRPLSDELVEGRETVVLTLSPSSEYVIEVASRTIQILDAPRRPCLRACCRSSKARRRPPSAAARLDVHFGSPPPLFYVGQTCLSSVSPRQTRMSAPPEAMADL